MVSMLGRMLWRDLWHLRGPLMAAALVVATWVGLDANYLKAFNMNTLKKILLIAVCSGFYQGLALAQANMPANDASTAALVELCKNSIDQDAQNFCFGFGEGVFQAYLASRPANAKPSICFPQQGARIFKVESIKSSI